MRQVALYAQCGCCRRWYPVAKMAGLKCAPCSGQAPRPQRHSPGAPADSARQPRDPERAAKRAADYAEQLVREGWSPLAAAQRARAAYGLAKDAGAPLYVPGMSEAYRRELRDEMATARPGAGGAGATISIGGGGH